MTLREEADAIVRESIRQVLPDEAVARALQGREFGSGKLYVVAVGKAAWQMARTASDILGRRMESGICITKYGYVKGEIGGIRCFEAGHPVPDENSFQATEEALRLVGNLEAEDTVVFLLSGGGSALFEKPLVSGEELADITDQLLACGADIVEMNTVRKRLSAVKGGRFAESCRPAKVYSVILSDILGDPLDMIASGPACPDTSTCAQALAMATKYTLKLSEKAIQLLSRETPKSLSNVETVVTGSVKNLCRAAAAVCKELGYEPHILTDRLDCQAREAVPGCNREKPSGRQEEPGLYRRRRDGGAPDRKGEGRSQPGAGPGGGRGNLRAGGHCRIQRGERWHGRPYGCGRWLLRRQDEADSEPSWGGHLPDASGE